MNALEMLMAAIEEGDLTEVLDIADHRRDEVLAVWQPDGQVKP